MIGLLEMIIECQTLKSYCKSICNPSLMSDVVDYSRDLHANSSGFHEPEHIREWVEDDTSKTEN